MDTPEPKRLRLQHIKIQNIKVLDALEIDLPAPQMKGDPDVFVFGSKNGSGKTSLLESCALLFLFGMYEKGRHDFQELLDRYIDLKDLVMRSGTETARVEGDLVINEETANFEIVFSRPGGIRTRHYNQLLVAFCKAEEKSWGSLLVQSLYSMFGFSADPLFLHGLMYFHSYRKIQEGNPELGMMVSGERENRTTVSLYQKREKSSVSIFKGEVLRSMMGKADLFETSGSEQSQDVLNQLNGLIRRYAGGTIEKLRPSIDNTVDFRITPTGGGPSFAFDGLSSGQKEIISTLFLIWFHSKEQPCIVLIDEPELHLNAEWQRDFIYQLHKLAPWNQYIIATHSQDVFESVPQERRFLLASGKGGEA